LVYLQIKKPSISERLSPALPVII